VGKGALGVSHRELDNSFTSMDLQTEATHYREIELTPFESKTVFLIQASRSHLNLIPKEQMNLEFRSSSIVLDEVLFISLMVQIDNQPLLTYGGWLNYHQSGDLKQCFTCLAVQESIQMLFFDENGRLDNIIKVNNHLRIGFQDYLRQLKNRLPWSVNDFESAKSKLLRLYPTTLSLWHGLKTMAERENEKMV
jgi:hypothetical protein